jgi:hypothetical protein
MTSSHGAEKQERTRRTRRRHEGHEESQDLALPFFVPLRASSRRRVLSVLRRDLGGSRVNSLHFDPEKGSHSPEINLEFGLSGIGAGVYF